jgi:hypothetical protein
MWAPIKRTRKKRLSREIPGNNETAGGGHSGDIDVRMAAFPVSGKKFKVEIVDDPVNKT